MTLTVFAAIMAAAALHAVWNALVKNGGDKVVSMTAVIAGHLPPCLLAIPFLPWPGWSAWPYFVASVALHTGYQLFLMRAYRLGDFAQVYPVARGSGPAIVALVSATFLGLAMSGMAWLAIALICIGVIGMGVVRQADGLRNPAALLAALGTGLFIAGYSLSDGLGARAADDGVAFIVWAMAINSALFTVATAIARPRVLDAIVSEGKAAFWIGGTGSVVAYTLAVWAMTQVPIAVVTALRETSVVFGLAIAGLFFGEKVGAGRLAAVALILSGAALLRLSL